MLTFSSISASVGRESEGTRWVGPETIWRWARVRLAACCECILVRVGRIGMSGLVAVSEAVIVNIMPLRDDNGCQAGETRGNRAPVPHLRGRGDPCTQ